MQEIAFNIPISGTIRIENSKIIITFNPGETTLDINEMPKNRKRISLDKGQTVFDIVLQAAQQLVASRHDNRFTAAELYHEALKRHLDMKRNSCVAHVIASAPNHPSYNHFATKKDYFKYFGKGIYKLESRYKKIDENNLLKGQLRLKSG